ncbi:Uncharacterised protein [Bacteroides heparinolyticus]|uniref:Lipoprotein n=1 Tax=Prevotella heparinolytica TaxID=28113 RepID=A0A449HZT9_9BACE|nr:hypothetical protein [Bacteroides heparinolyticus]VFB12674.1 Uncharacterised protein [Bacteroides heparinolyticus]
MKKNFFLLILAFVQCTGFLISSCKDEASFYHEPQLNLPEKRFERLKFQSSQDLLAAIKDGENNGVERANITKSRTFKSLLSNCNSSTRSIGETYYEVLGYDTLVPNHAFAVLLNPLGEVQSNDTIYRINHNGTYYFHLNKEKEFNEIYPKDSIGTLIGENLYKLADGIYRYKTFLDNVKTEEIDFPDNESDDSWDDSNVSTRAVSEPNYNSFPRFNADRHTWAGKIWQKFFGNDKYYEVKLSKKRKVKGRLYAYHYVVYSESGVTGMMKKKNWIGWSKTQADELRIGWNNIVLEAKIDDPSLQGIPKQKVPIVSNIIETNIPSIGKGNLVTIFGTEIEKKDLLRVVAEGLKEAAKFGNKHMGSGRNPNIHAACIATRSKLYLVILNDMRKAYNIKSMTHTFTSRFNIMVSIDALNLPSSISEWGKTLSKTLRQKSFKLIGGEAIICGRLGTNWKGMKIVKEID